MRISKRINMFGAVAAAGCLAVVGISASPALATTVHDLSAEALVPVLSRTASASDQPDPDVLAGSLGDTVVASSVRAIGASDATSYYVAEGVDAGQVCLLAISNAVEGLAAAACTDRQNFYVQGLSLGLAAGDDQPQFADNAYLFPPDVAPPSVSTYRSAAKSLSTAKTGAPGSQIVIVKRNAAQPSAKDFVRQSSGAPFNMVTFQQNG